MAGIGASITLTKKNIPHLILEARDRIGGRIHSVTMGENVIDLGASWIHGIGPGTTSNDKVTGYQESLLNPIYKLAQDWGLNLYKTWDTEDGDNTQGKEEVYDDKG